MVIKEDLVQAVRERCGLYAKDAEVVVEAIVQRMAEAMEARDTIVIRGFGTFRSVYRKGKVGQTFGRGETNSVEIPAHYTVKFEPSNKVVKTMNKQRL